MSFIKTVEEQVAFRFTGRINILLASNNQFLGRVLLNEGVIVNATFKGQHDKPAMFSIIFEDLDGKFPMKFVVEPEVVPSIECKMKADIEKIKKEAARLYEQRSKSLKLRPPDSLHLMIDSDFIIEGAGLSYDEFQVMDMLTEFSKVGDLYKHLDMFDYEITKVLVSLRKKKALKVIKV